MHVPQGRNKENYFVLWLSSNRSYFVLGFQTYENQNSGAQLK